MADAQLETSSVSSDSLWSEAGEGSSLLGAESRSVVSELDSFVGAAIENESTLRENDSALSVLERLDQYWFWDNIITFGLCSRPLPRSLNSSPVLSPFRSIEMVNSKAGLPTPNDERNESAQLPKQRLERTTSSGLEKKDRKLVEKRWHHRRSLSDMPIDLSRQGSGSAGVMYDRPVSENFSSINDLLPEIKNRSTERVVHAAVSVKQTTPSSIRTAQHSGIPKAPKLETIASGKQFQEPALVDVGVQQARLRRRERRRGTKSMTDLEFDELKGFMDLGFRFNKDELSPKVVSILPGLQRLGAQGRVQEPTVSRPYLSEAWLIRRSDSPLLNWRMPSLNDQGVDMKEHLKFWARAVASTVQQES